MVFRTNLTPTLAQRSHLFSNTSAISTLLPKHISISQKFIYLCPVKVTGVPNRLRSYPTNLMRVMPTKGGT